MASPAIPVDMATLKAAVRSGLSASARERWWPILPGVGLDSKIVDVDPDIPGCAERLAGVLKEPLLDYKALDAIYKDQSESDQLESSLRNLAYVLSNTNKLDKSNTFYMAPFLRLLLHQIKRIDVCCWMCNTILAAPERFGRFDFQGSFAINHTFKDLLKQFSPQTYQVLASMGALDDKYLQMLFMNFFLELLPPDVVLAIVDAYLLEGRKVLIRYALALVASYKSHIKDGIFSTAKDFWLTIKADSVSHTVETAQSMLSKGLGLEETLPLVDSFVIHEACVNAAMHSQQHLQELAFDRGRSLLKKASRPMPIGTKTIAALYDAYVHSAPPAPVLPPLFSRKASFTSGAMSRGSISEKVLNSETNSSATSRKTSMRAGAGRQSLSPSPAPSMSTNEVPSPPSSPGSPTQSIKGGEVLIFPSPSPASFASAPFSDSQLLGEDMQAQLRAVLPAPLSTSPLRLRYASYRHGWDLTSLYACVAPSSPRQHHLVLLFKLQAPHGQFVLGATLRGPLQPSDSVLGDGATSLLLRLCLPELREEKGVRRVVQAGVVETFPWIGVQEPAEYRALVEATDRGEVAGELVAALNQFCRASSNGVSFGASVEHSCCALRLDSRAMGALFVGPSETFNSPVLAGAGKGTGEQCVPLQDIEIFSSE